MIKNFALLVFTLFICLLAGEGIARVFGYDKYQLVSNKVLRLHPFNCDFRCNFDGDEDWHNDPDYFSDPKRTEFTIRGETYKKEKPSFEKRVLFLGDSATYGQYVKKDERYSSLLEKEFNITWRMINAGVIGFDNVDQLIMLKRLLALKPDVVIWQVFMANDLNYNILFSTERRIEFFNRFQTIKKSALLKLAFISLIKANYNPLAIFRPLGKQTKNVYDNSATDQRGLRFMHYHEGEYALYHKEPSSLEPHVYRTFSEIARTIKKELEERGIALKVVLVPTRSSVRNDLVIIPDLEDAKKTFGKSEDFYKNRLDYQRPLKKVREVLKNQGIEYYDPVEEDNITESFFIDGDDHPSQRGHLFYAENIGKFLRKWEQKAALHN